MEYNFGVLRRTQPNAELSVETYIRSSAIHSLRMAVKKPATEPTSKPQREAPLSDTRFVECCGRAYTAALELASWAAGCETASLQQYYEDSVSVGWFKTQQQPVPLFVNEDDSDEEAEAAEQRTKVPPL